ncbi:YfkD famly protein [Halobacillus amylolyticus]|uniref:YfkD family protein n=1 Tax=Halobacillus amylolyticus TaxID=2932259 RepID=A0ABY4HFV6_9BACI|nr:YfkD famly protein [Halobacillus amylolyticus]UOR13411.1 YfkD family protein [Halobacillus amylolyticus]
MKFKWLGLIVLIGFISLIPTPLDTQAKDKENGKNSTIPNHVLNISKDNTYPNSTDDQEVLEAEELTDELMEESELRITNPQLIEILNETTLKPSPFALGYRAEIFLGRWPLAYESKESNINWEYQEINVNELDNHGGNQPEKMSYEQKEEKHIKGGLTSKISHSEQMMKLILLEAQKNTKLPLSFHTVIGAGTKQKNTYSVPVNKTGILHAYAPAINEKGEVAFGDVYIKLKGSKKSLEVKNVTRQGIGAWIPIQDHVGFSFELK